MYWHLRYGCRDLSSRHPYLSSFGARFALITKSSAFVFFSTGSFFFPDPSAARFLAIPWRVSRADRVVTGGGDQRLSPNILKPLKMPGPSSSLFLMSYRFLNLLALYPLVLS